MSRSLNLEIDSLVRSAEDHLRWDLRNSAKAFALKKDFKRQFVFNEIIRLKQNIKQLTLSQLH